MICNQTETGWEIIYQRAHALLAAKLVTYWRQQDRPSRWTETLNAIAQHDNGWQEWEPGQRLTDAGAPRNFDQMDIGEVVLQAERAVVRAWHQSLWTGLLVSCHVSHLYEPRRGALKALDELLDEQEPLRQKWRRALGVTKKEVSAAYSLLLWGDTFSLTLCRRDLPFGQRALEIGQGPDGTSYQVVQREDGAVTVKPWPYEKDEFCVSVDVHYLNQLSFADDDELAEVLRTAETTSREWRLTKS